MPDKNSTRMKFEIGGRMVGRDCPPLLVPDIGTFFNKDVALAKSMIDALSNGGAEIIKGEILHDASVCLDTDVVEGFYDSSNKQTVFERYRDLIERKVVPLQKYEEIFSLCKDKSLPFLVSVYDFEGADFARDIGTAALKIATSNVVHEPLIRHCARTGLPLIIDTGKSTLSEITRAVSWAKDSGCTDLVVEHSPLPPPAPVDMQNLRILDMLEDSLSTLVGLSDHHAGPEMLYAASALGASILEKGICPDDGGMDQDVAHALPVSQFADVKRVCDMIYAGIGSRELPPVKTKKLARMGLVAKTALNTGATVSLQTVSFAFPAVGIPVEQWSTVEGWQVRRDLQPGEPVTWSDVEPLAS